MSLFDFLENLTDADWISWQLNELFDITREFGEDIVDLCSNEGVEIVKSTPEVAREIGVIVAPLSNPTPVTILCSCAALLKVVYDD